MPSNAISGVGTQFRYWASATWNKLAEIVSLTGPGMTRETIKVTNLDSEGGFHEFITSFRDAGTVTLNMNFTRATYDVVFSHFLSDTLVNYEIVLPDSETTTIEFAGLVTECPISVAAEDRITADVTIKISGEPTINSGSGSGT